MTSRIEIPSPRSIDPSAILGHPSPRLKPGARLVLGPGACLRSHAVLYLGSVIGRRLETGHNVVIREGNRIGDDFQIWNNSVVDYGCRIGRRVKIHCNVYVAQYTTLEDEVFLAPGVTVANDLYPGRALSKKWMRGPHLARGVQVGVNATILPYVHIGKGSLIGAGSVVTKDIPPDSMAWGNPARVYRSVKAVDAALRSRLLAHAGD